MPKQNGSSTIIGTVDNMTYYNSKHGPLMRKKGGVSGDRIANDPRFIRTRESLAEFTAAGKAGKLLRRSLISLMKGTSDHIVTGRLVKKIMVAVKEDAINGRGLRNITDGDTTLLRGFEFNTASPLSTSLQAITDTVIDRVTGELKWTIAPFLPQKFVVAPKEATHFKIVMAAAEVDFKNETYVSKIVESADMELNNILTAELELKANITANSKHPLFLVGGIQFVQKIKNGDVYPLNNAGHNALQILDVTKA